MILNELAKIVNVGGLADNCGKIEESVIEIFLKLPILPNLSELKKFFLMLHIGKTEPKYFPLSGFILRGIL